MKTHYAGSTRRAVGVWAVGVVLIAAVLCRAQGGSQVQNVYVTKGGIKVVEVPFAVRQFSVADREAIRVEQEGAHKLRIIGLAQGTTAVAVMGEEGTSFQYAVTVVADIKSVAASVKKRIEEVPGVEAGIDEGSGRVVIRGVVSSLAHWRIVEQVVSSFAPLVENDAAFDFTPEAKQRLMDAFGEVGIRVVEKGSPEAGKPGVLTLRWAHNNLILSGTVWSKNDLVRIERVLAAHQWMIGKPDQAPDQQRAKVMAILDVGVDSSVLEVGVAFLLVRDNHFSERTGNLLKQGLMVVNDTALALQGKLGPEHSEHRGTLSGQYLVSAGLEGTLRLLAGEIKADIEKVGHLTLVNNSQQPAVFQDGGRLIIRVSGTTSGDVKEIPYGLLLKAVATLRDPATAELMLDASASLPRPTPSGDYDMLEQKIENVPVVCKLGHTLVLAGSRQRMRGMEEAGVPGLRRIPVVKWFFSERTREAEDLRLLILVNPQMGPAAQPDQPPYSEQTRSALNESTKPR